MPYTKQKNNKESLKSTQDLQKAFDNYYKSLCKYVYVRLRDKEISENIVQESLIKAWQNRKSFDPNKSSLKNWLFVITINTMRDYYRKNKYEIEEIDENMMSNENIKADMEKEITVNFVYKQINKLSEKEQNIIILRYQEDLKMNEIAEKMGMKNSAVKVAVFRAMKKLQALCQDIEEII